MNDNKMKSLKGLMQKDKLVMTLKKMQDEKIISSSTSGFRCGYGGNHNQFYVPFVIVFNDQTKWMIFSSNSIRSDRMCIQQWNAEHIKRIDPLFSKAVIVVNSENRYKNNEASAIDRYKKAIKEADYYSALDEVVYLDELEDLIKTHAK